MFLLHLLIDIYVVSIELIPANVIQDAADGHVRAVIEAHIGEYGLWVAMVVDVAEGVGYLYKAVGCVIDGWYGR